MPMPKGVTDALFKTMSVFMKLTPVEPDILLKDGDMIGNLSVLHAPGHTPGSIALFDKERGIVFVGDSLRYKEGKLQEPPKQFTYDIGQSRASIRKIAQLNANTMLAGHGEVLKDNAAKMIGEFAANLTK
jgi:glyoxylase-like metal-dependent hydrolase (beta-lactamase superfamily II)